MAEHCAVHGATESVARCGWCAARMCDACFRFAVAGAPICVRCAHERATRARRRVSLGVFTALVSIGGAGVLGVRVADAEWALPLALLTALLGAVLGVLLVGAGVKHARAQPALQRREELTAWTPRLAAHARAARARRALAALAPSLSARSTALAALAAMVFSSVSFPALLRLPRWLELEAVLALWWLGTTLGLFVLLYRGYRIEDDHFFQAADVPRISSGLESVDPSGCETGCGDGCGDVLGMIALALAAALLAVCSLFVAWLLVELALPLLFLAFYSAVLLALRRAARDRHDCPGRWLPSLRWAITWSSLYLAPIAALLWVLHRSVPALR